MELLPPDLLGEVYHHIDPYTQYQLAAVRRTWLAHHQLKFPPILFGSDTSVSGKRSTTGPITSGSTSSMAIGGEHSESTRRSDGLPTRPVLDQVLSECSSVGSRRLTLGQHLLVERLESQPEQCVSVRLPPLFGRSLLLLALALRCSGSTLLLLSRKRRRRFNEVVQEVPLSGPDRTKLATSVRTGIFEEAEGWRGAHFDRLLVVEERGSQEWHYLIATCTQSIIVEPLREDGTTRPNYLWLSSPYLCTTISVPISTLPRYLPPREFTLVRINSNHGFRLCEELVRQVAGRVRDGPLVIYTRKLFTHLQRTQLEEGISVMLSGTGRVDTSNSENAPPREDSLPNRSELTREAPVPPRVSLSYRTYTDIGHPPVVNGTAILVGADRVPTVQLYQTVCHFAAEQRRVGVPREVPLLLCYEDKLRIEYRRHMFELYERYDLPLREDSERLYVGLFRSLRRLGREVPTGALEFHLLCRPNDLVLKALWEGVPPELGVPVSVK